MNTPQEEADALRAEAARMISIASGLPEGYRVRINDAVSKAVDCIIKAALIELALSLKDASKIDESREVRG